MFCSGVDGQCLDSWVSESKKRHIPVVTQAYIYR